MGVSRFLAGTALLALVATTHPSSSLAETITYTYDALGRLRASSVSGGASNGTNTAICYDPAGNRERNVTTVAGAASCTQSTYPTPAPAPTPTPAPAPSFAISDAEGFEGETLVFVVSRSGSTSGAYSMSFATANGSAGAADFAAQSGTLTFGSGESVKYIYISTYYGEGLEITESFYVNLSGASGGATISDSQGVGTIYDISDPCPGC